MRQKPDSCCRTRVLRHHLLFQKDRQCITPTHDFHSRYLDISLSCLLLFYSLRSYGMKPAWKERFGIYLIYLRAYQTIGRNNQDLISSITRPLPTSAHNFLQFDPDAGMELTRFTCVLYKVSFSFFVFSRPWHMCLRTYCALGWCFAFSSLAHNMLVNILC